MNTVYREHEITIKKLRNSSRKEYKAIVDGWKLRDMLLYRDSE
jgi:hypothetical protein